MKILLIIAVIVFFNLQFSKIAFANTSCQPIYGGGQSCITSNNIVINKKVLNPETNKFVDNLGINDPKYHPGFITTFQISITNSGNSTISKISVKDIFPQYVTFSSGPGKFDDKTKTLSFSVENLKSDETKTFVIMGRIADMDKISINQGSVVCVVNQANATSDNNNFSQDNAQFCIEKTSVTAFPTTKGGFPVLPPSKIKTTPATGPNDFALIGLAITGIAGYILRKKSH